MSKTTYPRRTGLDQIAFFDDFTLFPSVGSSDVIYVDRDNSDLYLWTGVAYDLQSGGGGAWGSITGTVSDQADLQAILNAKEDEFDWNINPDRQSLYWTDFMVIDRGGLAVHNSGTGSFVTNDDTTGMNTTENVVGGLMISCGTDVSGRIAPFTSGYCSPGTNKMRLGLRSSLSVLSSADPEYYITFGVGDNLNLATEIADGVYFKYTHTENGGRWRACVASAGVRAYLDCGVSPVVGVFQNLEIQINDAWSEALFYINGALVATHSSGLPATSALIRPHWKLQKLAGSSEARQSSDWFYCKHSRTAAR